jgi:ribosome-associated translation inhibitor RaiA
MDNEAQITFRRMPASEALERDIRERAAALVTHYGRLVSCRIAIDAPHRHRKGGLFHVRITVRMPRHEAIGSREHHGAHEHEDVYVAVRDAFLAVRRQLDDTLGRRRAKVHVPHLGALAEPGSDSGRR